MSISFLDRAFRASRSLSPRRAVRGTDGGLARQWTLAVRPAGAHLRPWSDTAGPFVRSSTAVRIPRLATGGIDIDVAVGAAAPRAPSASWLERVRSRVGHLSLATRFILTNLVVLLLAAVVVGWWTGQQIEESVLARTAGVTALYVDSFVSPHIQTLARSTALDAPLISSLDSLVAGTSFGDRIVALKVWSTDGTIVYSPDHRLIGRRFPVEGGLARAIDGEVASEMSDLTGDENEYERQRWSRLVEVYAPARIESVAQGGRVIAVVEFYQRPDELEREVRSSQISAWAVVGLTMLAAYLLLAGIVRGGSDTIVRQSRALRERVRELQRVIAENRTLQARVAHAARSSTASNEQALRRISADLHDGPAQALALALLRLEATGNGVSGEDAATVRRSVADALDELRAIAAGLRSPELDRYTPAAVVERTAHDHERRSGTAVALDLGRAPEAAPLATKIALHRILQEALSNATRHGHATRVAIHLSRENGALHLAVHDDGGGFSPDAAAGLGLAGMRERAELLGGAFEVRSLPGEGSEVSVVLPLIEGEE